jgi:Lipocalin-like domain
MISGRCVRFAALAAVTALPSYAAAQHASIKSGLVGAWSFVSVTAERADGSKTEIFGANPKGIMVFTPDGHFSLFQSRAEIPRLAANDRAKATPEEAIAVMQGSIAYYGTYSVNESDKTMTVKIEASTFANLVGPEQKRIITSLTADELHFINPRTPAGVTLHTVWKRAPSR